MSEVLFIKRDDRRKTTFTLKDHFKLDTSGDTIRLRKNNDLIAWTPTIEEMDRLAEWILKKRGFA